MSTANNSNPRSLRNHSEARACPHGSAAKLNDCLPSARAEYEGAMGKWRQQDAHARKFGLPLPPEPQLVDFLEANGGEDTNPGGHDTARETQLDSGAEPANDNLPQAATSSDSDAGTESANAQEQITEDNVVPLPVAKKLNGSQPLEQYDAAQNDITQIEPANANTPSVRPTAISPIFANIPAVLKERPNWLM